MPSTYSSLKIQLMEQGENNNQWGNITNTNLGTAIEEAIVGSADVSFVSGNVTLTLTDVNTTQPARNLRLNLSGATAARELVVPSIEKFYVINNGNAYAITVKTSLGTGIVVPAGKTSIVYVDATDVVDAVTHLTSLTLASSLPVTSGGTGTTTSTGTGSVVLSNSPTLVTPALGTPASGVLTNATGLPISTGVSGLGTGVATFLGTPSSSNLAAAVTDETGSGALVFGTSPTITSPTLVTPALGTPASGVLTNATGLPISTGVSGLGTGVATFLGTPSSSNLAAAVTDETGTGALVFATSPTLVTPLLGTPTSGVMTNVTGLPLTTGVTGTLPVGNGGTGATTLTSNGILYGGATVGVTAAGTTGQVLVGNTGGAPSWAAATSTAVTSISFGSTGLTPSTATQGVVTVAGTLAVANGGTGVTTSTGTGSVVLSTSPTLVTPALGTPSSATLTNATGLPISTGVSGLGTGVATFLGTPSSANLAAAVTDETGSGALVFATSPTLVTPALGTPSSATLTNATGLPISTGVSGLGTGVATFLATPSSANLAAAVTDETGSGALVFANTPTLVTPVIGAASATSLALAAGLVATPALTFTGDLNTGMWSPAADTIAWSTAGSERMRITSAGDVGIGVTNPGQALVVRREGDVRIYVEDDNASGRGGYLRSVTGGAVTLGTTSGVRDLVFAPDNSERMRITTGGNVGIGTTSPVEKLDVVGNIDLSGTGNRRISFFSSTNWQYNLATTGDNFSVYDADNTNFLELFYSGTLAFKRASVLNALHVLQGGDVGIGTTAPDVFGRGYSGNILGVSSSSGQSAIELNSATGSAAYIDMGVNTVRSGSIYADASTFEVGALTGSIDLGLTTNGTRRVTIGATSGNVGIGTTSITSVFGTTVRAFNAGSGATLQLGGTAVNAYFYAAEGLGLSAIGNSSNHPFMFFTNDVERMRVTAAGNVGIGTTGPVNKLQSTYTAPVSVPAAGASAHGFAVGDTGFGLAAGALNSGNAYLQATRWDGTATNYNLILQPNGGNVGIGTTDQFGTGTRVIGLANATANPSTNPTGGGVLYADAGALKWRGSSGTVTTIANA